MISTRALLLRPAFASILIAILASACTQGDARTAGASVQADTLSDSVLVARADRGRTIGSESAPIWIVMISDYQCPYCKQFHDGPLKLAMKDYVENGKARFAYLHLPLPNHPHSRPAARAALCASAQGKFFEYSDSIFAIQSRLGTVADASSLLTTIAQQVALDMPQFAHCQKSGAIERLVQSDERQSAKANVRSTPSFFVGQYLIEGMAPYENFRTAVDSALATAARKR
jgi:protein-disulfide isomerase